MIIKFDTNSIPPSASEIRDNVNAILATIADGEIDPLKVHIKAKAYMKFLELLTEGTSSYALDEADKYGKEGKLLGHEFKISSTGDRYDYEADQEYRNLKKSLKEREDNLKASVKYNGDFVLDGELIPKVPIKSHSKSMLTVTIK